MSQSMKKRFPSLSSIDVGTDGNTSFLRAARNGQLDKVLEHLKSNIDINTSNANGLNALHLASKDGHVDIVEELLKRGAVVDAATKKGNTALHIASLAGQEEVVKLLVNHGASVNVQSQNGFTPLYMAAQENHDNVVKYLLANGANQSLSTEDGFTPLAVAMQQGHDKVVTVLLENDTRGKVRLPALHIAAKKDDVKAAKLLLENEHNPDVTSKSGFTPLHIASHYGNQSIANLLVQKGADVNYAAKHNITPLHVAAKWGKTNMVTVLLERGANIESKTRDGLTPLHCAARSGHEQVVDMLLEKGAPISSKTKNGLAPLHMAAQGDHVDAARILLYHRAPVDEVTVDYLTALHVAAHCGHVRVAKLLLDRQADANARALNGFTPLHIACKKNRIKVVELLLKHGASIGATTESGLTPLHVASFMGCMNIVIYLLQHDANPDVPTVRGETPLHLAARANQTDIIRILLRNGAQVDARAREQQTPLHIASRLGNVDIVMLLLQHGAKVDNTTKDMYTALHIAAKEGQDEVAASLIDNGATLNSTTKKGFTPLHLAAKYGHLKVAKLLLQKEAPVDAQGKNGVTPLHVASHYDHQNVALLLLEKGASPYATAKNGHTPLHIAAKKNQMDIANTLLEYGGKPNAESKAGFTPLHLSAQEGHSEMSDLLIEHQADTNQKSKNGLTPLHLCAQEDKVPVAEVLVKNGAEVDVSTKNGYTPLHIACHYGQINMVRFLLSNGANVNSTTSLGYTPLHQAAQQGHTNIVNTLLENSAQPNAVTNNGQTPLHIAQKLGYITVIDTLKVVTQPTSPEVTPVDEKYRVVAPEAMHETFMSDSEEEGGEDTVLGDQTYRYLTADEMKSLGDDSLPIDVTRDERVDSNKMVNSENMYPPQHIEDTISPEHIHQNYVEYIKKYTPDNIDINRHPINIGKLHWKNFLVSFLVDARGGAMRGCRHSGVRVIVPPRSASSPTRITCRYVRPQRTPHPPPLMEGEALASRVLELGPVGAKFLGPVIIEVPHFAALRGKEREIVILRSDNGESWKEHSVDNPEEVVNDVFHDSFEAEDLSQLEDISSGRITRIVTQDFPQYFAVVSRIRQEVHAIGPEGGMVSSTVVPQVQAVFPQGALTKKIKVGLQAQPIDPELTAKLLGHGVAVSPVVTVEPRRRKFHKAITLSMPAPRAHSQGMINQYSGSTPTLRLLCSITGGTTRAQWEDVTGSTPLTFVNDCVSFTTTVSARFWLMDCRNVGDATKMATELYKEAIHVPFMAKFVVFAKRVDPLEARLRVFCMTDDKEDKTLEHQEHFTEVAKSRDVEVLEGKSQFIEFAGNLVPITKSGEQLQFSFRAFRENRLPFSVRVKDQHAEAVSRCLFMREAKVPKGEPPQQPICILNIVLPDDIVVDTISLSDSDSIKKQMYASDSFDYYRPDPRLADMSNLLGEDWVPLATQLGLTQSEINVIKSEYPDSVAKQGQSMLRMWLSQSGNKAQADTLESALRRIGREDIIPQCLNVDYGITTSRIKSNEETERQRLTSRKTISLDEKDMMKDSESVESLIKKEDVRKKESFDKYSAEEKVVEETSDEEDFNKTVTERRHQIEERLSVDRSVPASSQRVEIVQEITSIKRQSLVENKIAEVEQKLDVTVVDAGKTTQAAQQPAPELTPSELMARDAAARRDSDLLEGVTQSFETKKTLTKIISNDDPKSPKVSKTPPPSPADFIIREQAAVVQEWDIAKKSAPKQETSVTKDAEQQGTTTERFVASYEEKLLDKPVGQPLTGFVGDNLVVDIEQTHDQTNAFIRSESQPEPYDEMAEKFTRKDEPTELQEKKMDDNKNNINEKKKVKKGFFGSLKTFVEKSLESDSDSEKSPKKTKKPKKDKKKKSSKPDLPLATGKPKLPTPPLEPHDVDSIPYVEASPSDIPPPYKPPAVPLRDLNSETTYDTKPVLEKEHFSVVIDSTNKSKEAFKLNIDESIDNIEKEILKKSPILSPDKIKKPLVDLDQPLPPTVRDHIYEDIDEPRISPRDENLIAVPVISKNVKIATTDMIQNELNFGAWAEDQYNVINRKFEPDTEKEIIEKQDKEKAEGSPETKKKAEAKDKKGFLGGLFKKSKKDSFEAPDKKQVTLSDVVLQEMNDSKKFLTDEVDNYHDVRPIVPEVGREELVKSDGEEVESKPASGIFSIFKKSKKDSEEEKKEDGFTEVQKKPLEAVAAKDETTTETKTEKLDPKDTELEAKDLKAEVKEKGESSGFFGLFKKAKKEDEPKSVLSETVLKDIDDSKQFLAEEVNQYHDVKEIIKPQLAEVAETRLDEVRNKKEDVKSEPVEVQIVTKEVSSKIDVKEVVSDTKPVKTETKETKHERKESKGESGFFSLFKKSKKEEELLSKAPISDALTKDIDDSKQFLSEEVSQYHDVKPTQSSTEKTAEILDSEIKSIEPDTKTVDPKEISDKSKEAVKETKHERKESKGESSSFFGLFRKSKKDDEVATKLVSSEDVLSIEKDVVTKLTEEIIKQDDAKVSETVSEKQTVIEVESETKVKIKTKPEVLETEIVHIKTEDYESKQEPSENQFEVEKTLVTKIEVKEIKTDFEKDIKTELMEDKLESKEPKVETKEAKGETGGFFAIFKKPKKDEEHLVKPVLSDSVLKDMEDSKEFLSGEIEQYQDVKLLPPLPAEEEKVLDKTIQLKVETEKLEPKEMEIKQKKSKVKLKETKTDSKESKGVFGLFKKSKKDEDAKPTPPELVVKDVEVSKEAQTEQSSKPDSKSVPTEDKATQEKSDMESKQEETEVKVDIKESKTETAGFLGGLFRKSKKEEKLAFSETVLKSMDDSKQFLSEETDKYHDVKPVKFDPIEDEKITNNIIETVEAAVEIEEKPKELKEKKEKRDSSETRSESKSESGGFFGLFRKSKKDDEIKPTLSESALKDMDDSRQFLNEEIDKYYDYRDMSYQTPSEEEESTKTVVEVVETKIDDLQQNPVEEIERKEIKETFVEPVSELKEIKIEPSEARSEKEEKESSGFFGLFKKSKKDSVEDSKLIQAEVTLKESDSKQLSTEGVGKYNEAISITSEEVTQKNTEFLENITDPKETKSEIKEKKSDSPGLFGRFKKPKKEQSVEKQKLSETAIKDMNDSKDFLQEEVDKYHDVKPQATAVIEEIVSQSIMESTESKVEGKDVREPKEKKSESAGLFGIFKKSKKDQSVDETKATVSESKDIVKDTDDSKECSSKEVIKVQDVKFVSETSDKLVPEEIATVATENKAESKERKGESTGLFGIFKKPKKEELEHPQLSESVVKDMNDSKQFLEEEVQKYHDVKPLKTDLVEEVLVKSCLEFESKPEETRDVKTESGGFLGFFKKSKKEDETSSEPEEPEIKVIETKTSEHSQETKVEIEGTKTEESGGFFSIFTKKEKTPERKAKKENTPEKIRKPMISDAVLKEMSESSQFITVEIENYHDVRPEATEKLEPLKMEENESSVKSGGFLNIFKKPKKGELEESVKTEVTESSEVTDIKILEAEPPKQGFLAKFKRTKKDSTGHPPISRDVQESMDETTSFLKTELENYEDGIIQFEPVDDLVIVRAQKEKSVTFDDSIKELKAEVVQEVTTAVELVKAEMKDISETVKEEKIVDKDIEVPKLTEEILEPTKAIEVTQEIKQDKKDKANKEKKSGIFNIFGKKSKSQDSDVKSSDESAESSPRKQKEKRRKSSPFKFFEKSKRDSKEKDSELAEEVKAEEDFEIDKAKDDVLEIEISNLIEESGKDLTEEVLESLDKKIEALKEKYSKETLKDIQDCRDFLFIEVDNYEDGKAEVVTDIDKDLDAGLNTILEKTMEVVDDTSRTLNVKTDETGEGIHDTAAKIVKETVETAEKTKKGFFSKLGSIFSESKKEIEDKSETTVKASEDVASTVKEGAKSAAKEVECEVKLAEDTAEKSIQKTIKVARGTSDAVKAKLSLTKEDITDAARKADETTSEALGTAKETLDKNVEAISKGIREFSDVIEKKATDTKEVVIDTSSKAIAAVDQTVADTKKGATESIQTVSKEIHDHSEEIKLKTTKADDVAKDTANKTKTEIGTNASDVKKIGEKNINETLKGLSDFGEKVEAKTVETRDAAIDKAKKIEESIKQTTATVIETTGESSKKASKEVGILIEKVDEKTTETKDITKSTVINTTAAVDQTAKDIKRTVDISMDEASKSISDFNDKVKISAIGAKSAAQGASEKTLEAVKDIATDIKQTTTGGVDKATKNIKEFGETVKEKVTETKEKTQSVMDKPASDVKKVAEVTVNKSLTDLGAKAVEAKDAAKDVPTKIVTAIDETAKGTKKEVSERVDKASKGISDIGKKTELQALDAAGKATAAFDKIATDLKEIGVKHPDEVLKSTIDFSDKAKAEVTEIKDVTKDAIYTTAKSVEKISDAKKAAEGSTDEASKRLSDCSKKIETKAIEVKDVISKAIADDVKIAADAQKTTTESANKALKSIRDVGEKTEKAIEAKDATSKAAIAVEKTADEAICTTIKDFSKIEDKIDKKMTETKQYSKQVGDKVIAETNEAMEKIKDKASSMTDKLKEDLQTTSEKSDKAFTDFVDSISSKFIQAETTAETSVDKSVGIIQEAKKTFEETSTKVGVDILKSQEKVEKIVETKEKSVGEAIEAKLLEATDKVTSGITKEEENIIAKVEQASKDVSVAVSTKAEKTKESALKQVADGDIVKETVEVDKNLIFQSLSDSPVKIAGDAQDKFVSKDIKKAVETPKITKEKTIDSITKLSSESASVFKDSAAAATEKLSQDAKNFIQALDQTKTDMDLKSDEAKSKLAAKAEEVDKELAKLTESLQKDISGETFASYVTSPKPTRRAVSQRYPKGERPEVREIVSISSEEVDDDGESYTVTEPEEQGQKRKPLFHIASEDDDSLEVKMKERRDSCKSNVLETLTENKLDNLLTSLETQLTKDLAESISGPKEEKVGSKVKEAEVKLEQVRKDSQADVDQIEQKLRDLDKALDSLEEATDPKLEKKLHRVERKFERMASEVIDKDVSEAKVSPGEAENRRETEFQRLVSQMSTEEVSDFQKEYSHLWDETTFSKSDEWDSKTPDSQLDVQELPQGEEAGATSVTSHEVSPSLKAEEDVGAQHSTQPRQVADQHQLSDEMKQLLKELEKESKQ